MADRGHNNLAIKTERLLLSEALFVKLVDPVKSPFIYVMVKSGRDCFGHKYERFIFTVNRKELDEAASKLA